MGRTSSIRMVARVALASFPMLGCGDDAKTVACAPSLGGAPCERWQASICQFADQCGIHVRDCRQQYAQFNCRSEAAATRCADAFLSATCDAPPADCDFEAVAHVEPAIAGCQQYVDLTCQSAVACGISADQAACLAEVNIDCGAAVALGDEFDECLLALANLDCSAWVLPISCAGVVVVR